MNLINNKTSPELADWVPETAFGKWFISTNIWVKYVLREAVQEFSYILRGRLPSGAIILDAGCGIGLSFPLLIEFFKPQKIIGIDIDQSTLESASKLLFESCEVQLIHGSARHLDLPDNSIDAVFCHQLIHHVQPQNETLRELYRVIKPGGLLLSSESCNSFINSFWVRLLFRHPKMVQKNAPEYIDLIRNAGFNIANEDIRTSTPWWSRVDFGLLEKWGLSSRKPDITEVISVAQKPQSKADN